MDTKEVDGHPRQGDADADQRVDRVTVERHGHQEDGTQAEHHREEQGQLWRHKPAGRVRT